MVEPRARCGRQRFQRGPHGREGLGPVLRGGRSRLRPPGAREPPVPVEEEPLEGRPRLGEEPPDRRDQPVGLRLRRRGEAEAAEQGFGEGRLQGRAEAGKGGFEARLGGQRQQAVGEPGEIPEQGLGLTAEAVEPVSSK